jgi:hypothetical protein
MFMLSSSSLRDMRQEEDYLTKVAKTDKKDDGGDGGQGSGGAIMT